MNEIPTCRVVAIPFTQIARKECGNEVAANIVAVGALGVLSGVVSPKSLEEALTARIPKGTEDINRRALIAGFERAGEIDLNALPESNIHEEEDL